MSTSLRNRIDLRDQRQFAMEKLSAKLPVEVTEATNGELLVSSVDANSVPVVLISATGVEGTLAFDDSTNPPTISGGASATVLALNSGSIQGSIDARTDAIQTLRDQLDLLARATRHVVQRNLQSHWGNGRLSLPGTTAATISLEAGSSPISKPASRSRGR